MGMRDWKKRGQIGGRKDPLTFFQVRGCREAEENTLKMSPIRSDRQIS